MSSFPAPVLGTPLSPSATRVMLLGSGELGKEVIIALQRLGVEVIAVDRYADAPGHQVAHRAHVVSMTDPAALRAVIEQERPHIIVPEIEAIATDLLVELEQEGVARVTPTARAARLTMNREGIRRLAAETLGLPTSPYQFVDTQDALQQAIDGGIGYPCVIKPVMSSSGKGQSVIRGPGDLDAAWRYAQEGGRVGGGRAIVEGFIDFDYEITLLTVRARGVDGQIETHFCDPIGHKQVDGDYVESWQPHPMSPAALARAREIALGVTGNLGGLGIFGVELFVAGDQVWFSEVSPRPHDTGMVTMITQVQNEFELHARALLGLPVDTALRQPGASSVIYGGLDGRGVTFHGVAQALAEPGTDVRLFGKPEAFVKRRMGVGLAVADTLDAAREKARRVSAAVSVKAA
ncbi:formate-dependent phosphoribosylglycinamide formyltransferase [Bordetella avium]|uniref:Formate-dependent phosphoribosylglycinamide formyltransferase n=1 Tax=Bordetella avium (strain 197N) TaxID=360910 RepID=PURT_BORA1|nr:formate-dependent phosphoribosylglycinamide formyltransferase [Bordetella avium]Q2KUD7.1 RecName: Full=Formate-dependent phosphoribosylglycinamide formyltransferase; AltName: Full=5'-phosphoribosylglycinamide transformylase 2; AltName: Full=Formate-dependent GAR transformylase; AltName: Full=GAR transformylase 2; Short=GART 2; AltName: Full=Non-folate glycinamide ribonucleotide transformylase; AltName: Full=Phosphoribosylglycinamide formyltransferase 2 [Bordetella avium 197N]AZY50448.1 phospho